ncbi:MAG: hypothetical protein ACYCTF_10745 [Acidiferrobacter sp.]
MKTRLLAVAVLSAGLSVGAVAANHGNGEAYAAVSGTVTVGVARDAALTRDQAQFEYLKGLTVPYAMSEASQDHLQRIDASTPTTEPADPDVGDEHSDLNPAGIDPSSDRPEEMQPKIERPEIQRPEIERPEVGRPEIERPVIERPSIDR